MNKKILFDQNRKMILVRFPSQFNVIDNNNNKIIQKNVKLQLLVESIIKR